MLAMFGRTPPLIWAGGAFAAGPFNAFGVSLALHVADRDAGLSRKAIDVTAACCTCRADTLTDWLRLVPLTEKASDEVRGKVFCRTGRYDDAVKLLGLLRNPYRPQLTLYLALAEHGRGRTAEAKQLLKDVTHWLDKSAETDPNKKNRDQLQWTERVQIDQLRGELKALLDNGGKG
jgi:hypothetical protein